MQPRIQLSALLWIVVALTKIKRIQRHLLPKQFAFEIKMPQEIFFYVFTGTRGCGELQVDLCYRFVTEIKSVFAIQFENSLQILISTHSLVKWIFFYYRFPVYCSA